MRMRVLSGGCVVCRVCLADGGVTVIIIFSYTDLGALILEHVSEIMVNSCNVITHQKNKLILFKYSAGPF